MTRCTVDCGYCGRCEADDPRDECRGCGNLVDDCVCPPPCAWCADHRMCVQYEPYCSAECAAQAEHEDDVLTAQRHDPRRI